MGKYILVGIFLLFSLSCSGVLGKDVLDRLVAKRQASKGRLLINYSITDIKTVNEREKLFYITANTKSGSIVRMVSDTIPVLTTGDGILIDGTHHPDHPSH